MGKIKQTVTGSKKATNKNAKYTYSVKKAKFQTTNSDGTTEKKYSYTKKVLVNGKYRYYYS